MKTFAFPTCKGLLRISALTRDEAIAIFKILARKNKRAQYIPLGKIKLHQFARMLQQPLINGN